MPRNAALELQMDSSEIHTRFFLCTTVRTIRCLTNVGLSTTGIFRTLPSLYLLSRLTFFYYCWTITYPLFFSKKSISILWVFINHTFLDRMTSCPKSIKNFIQNDFLERILHFGLYVIEK